MAVLATGVAVIVLVLGMTSEGRVIDAATQHFMLYYAGVFALIGLTTSVGVGLVATDRIIMTPGHRVMAQALHRAVSFGALTFLIIHIVTEILAQRVHVIDAVVPFLSPFRTFYIGLGTIASDLIILLVVTSILRKRFTAHGKAWRWRAIHYGAYVAFVFGVLHGLLGGRAGKPYVDWSYGFAIALTALAVAIRFLAISLRPKENLSAPPAGGKNGVGSSPLRAATMAMAQAQLGSTIQMLPAATGMQTASMGLPAAPPALQLTAGSPYGAYDDGGFTPLGAPPYGDAAPYGDGPSGPYASMPYADPMTMPYQPYQQPALASLPAPYEPRQPMYEPGYVGPPRYEGAPRGGTGPMPRLGTGPSPAMGTGPGQMMGPGPMHPMGSGPMPVMRSGPMPTMGAGPMSAMGPAPLPSLEPGPAARGGTGPRPRPGNGPPRHAETGPMPRAATGPMPRMDPASRPYADAGPGPRGGTGPTPPPGAPGGGRPPRRRPVDESWERNRPQRGGGTWR
jgi:DMSO/TMAO reductase YedYZ heme-binding membrane subunit